MSEQFVLPYPADGYNEMFPPYLLPDSQFSDLTNFYYDSSGKLVSRPGTEFVARFTAPVYGIGCLATVANSVAVQAGSVLYGRNAASGSSFVSLKTGVSQSSRYFAVMNTILYSGCENGDETNNLKWDPTTSAAVVWPGTQSPAIPLVFICTWNSRMWGVHRTNRTKIYFSKVGDAEDWATTGVSGAGNIEVGYSDGENITGLVVHNEQLFILKERSIWHIVTANPNTDNSAWRVEIVTRQFGCSNHRGICVLGNDVLFPSSKGIVSLNVALYQGDFKASNASAPIPTIAGGASAYCRLTNQFMTTVTWGSTLEFYCLERAQENARWVKMDIRNSSGSKLQPWLLASEYSPLTQYGKFYPGPNAGGMFSLICVAGALAGGVAYYDLLQYPSTKLHGAGHYDYIDGPTGSLPIYKKFTTKMFTFGNFGYEKRSSRAVFTCRKNDKLNASMSGQIDGDEMTFSAFFDGDELYSKQSVKITDTMIQDNTTSFKPLRTAVLGIGGANGQVYKGIQFQGENNIGGYELEYGGIETDVEQIGKFPRPSEKMLT